MSQDAPVLSADAKAKAKAKATAEAKAQAAKKKSPLKVLKPGEILFEDAASANSLYIIQKGQIRLFKPKGKGFVEIAVLRVGEVIGEMAYFDEQAGEGGGKRSCAAMALVSTEVIEISFAALDKTIKGLNPWFKTIINTLATRLRKTNARVRELESNSVSHNYGSGGASTYQFFKQIDIVRLFGLFYLVFKAQPKDNGRIHSKTMKMYAIEIYNVLDVKFEEFVNLLKDQGYLTIENDEKGLPKIFVIKEVKLMHAFMAFFNTQRVLPDEKKMRISYQCELFLEKILEQLNIHGDDVQTAECNLTNILNENQNLTGDDLVDALRQGFVEESLVNNDVVTCAVNLAMLRKAIPAIRMMNYLAKFNEKKADEVMRAGRRAS